MQGFVLVLENVLGHKLHANTTHVGSRIAVLYESSCLKLLPSSPPERTSQRQLACRTSPKASHGHTQGRRQVPAQESTDPTRAPPPGHVVARGSGPTPKGSDQMGSLSRSLDTAVQYLFRRRWERPQLRTHPECHTHSSKSHRHVQRIPQPVPPRASSRTAAISGRRLTHRVRRSGDS